MEDDDVYWTYGIHPEFATANMSVESELLAFRNSLKATSASICQERLKERSADREEKAPCKDRRANGSLEANDSKPAQEMRL